ncbi:MAG: hypothetical protein IK017_01455 [Paludibacteraceae bacterium]|nr:hypothetical protein [Paludibacteraceae bacterium]
MIKIAINLFIESCVEFLMLFLISCQVSVKGYGLEMFITGFFVFIQFVMVGLFLPLLHFIGKTQSKLRHILSIITKLLIVVLLFPFGVACQLELLHLSTPCWKNSPMDEWDFINRYILQFPTILFAIIIYLGKYCFVCSLFGRVNMIQRIYKFIKDVRRD